MKTCLCLPLSNWLCTAIVLGLAGGTYSGCQPVQQESSGDASISIQQEQVSEDSPEEPSIPLSDGFDFPVAPPDAKAYYNANPFGTDLHLGDDWNGVGGGNSDLGDPVYSISHGRVVQAKDHGGGWGKVIRIVHRLDSSMVGAQVESLYAHLDTLLVQTGTEVYRGQQIGTIGNADGVYYAHLHLEIRTETGLPLGGGYSSDTTGYTDPSKFIQQHRPK
ncbi:MAG: M23 family metallopeptidase [Bacteroidota bacterium]